MKQFVAMALVLLLAVSGTPAQEKPVKGTRVILTPPKGFAVAERFPGFMSEATGASIMVTEVPAPYADVTKSFTTAAELSKQGMTLLKQEKQKYGAYDGMLISVAQSGKGIEYLKWVAAFGDEKATFLVTATFPKAASGTLSEDLKKCVTGAKVSQTAVDPLEAVTFRIAPTNDLRLAKVLGNNIILSKGGKFPAKSSEVPVFIAGASASKDLSVADRKAFAQARLQRVAQKDIQLKTTQALKVDGLEGFECVADAVDPEVGVKMLVYQVVLFDKDGYYLMQGLAPESESKAQLPTFMGIARTFKKVNATKAPPK